MYLFPSYEYFKKWNSRLLALVCVSDVYIQSSIFLLLLHPSGGTFHGTLWGCDFRAGMRLSVATLTSSM